MQDAIVTVLITLALMGSVSPLVAADQTGGAKPTPSPANRAQGSVDAARDSNTNPPTARLIKSIEFEGNRKFKDHVLRDRLLFQPGQDLDRNLAEGGIETIKDVYRKVGYPSVEVSLDEDRFAEGHLLYRIKEGPRVRVGSIHFVGNEAFSSRTLKQVIKTKQRRWLFWPSYYISREAIEDEDVGDVALLKSFYLGRGHLNCSISAKTEFSADREKVHVTFDIKEGSVYRVADIVFDGQTRYTTEQLREMIKLREGDVYREIPEFDPERRIDVDPDRRQLRRLYREQGFIDMTVRKYWKPAPQATDNLVVAAFDIREGGQFRIGQIDIMGNETTKDKAIRRILDEYGFTPGELYNAEIAPKEGRTGRLEKYIERGVLADQVMIRPAPPHDDPSIRNDPNSRDVNIQVKEGSTGMIRPGVGFSSDAGVMGQLVFMQGNFDITDVPEDASEVLFPWKAFHGGGQTLTMRLEPGTRYSQYIIDFHDPYWRDEPMSLDVLGLSREWFRESHDEDMTMGSVAFERRLENRWRPSIGFHANNIEIGNLDFDAPQEIRDVQGNNDLFGVKAGLQKVELDDIYDPSAGWRAGVSYDQWMGDFTFGVLEGTYLRDITLFEDALGRKTILEGKLLAGTIFGDAPPFGKFYAGGTGRYRIRGFEYRGVSTRGFQTNVPFPQRVDPIGSDWVFLAGTELTFPLVGEHFRGLFFLDSGTVDTGRYRLSIGAGIEIKLPQFLGSLPMRFQLGFPVLEDDEDETQAFSFSGGSTMLY